MSARMCGAAGAVLSVHDPGGECLPERHAAASCESRDIRAFADQRGPGGAPTHGRDRDHRPIRVGGTVPTVESIESWWGQDVLDSAGEKAGRLEEVYYDAAGDEPVLISIKHGRLGHQVKLAPLSDAAVSRDYIRLPFTGEQLGGAPDVTVGDELTAEQCAAVFALFAVRRSSGPLVGASLRSTATTRRSRLGGARRRVRAHRRGPPAGGRGGAAPGGRRIRRSPRRSARPRAGRGSCGRPWRQRARLGLAGRWDHGVPSLAEAKVQTNEGIPMEAHLSSHHRDTIETISAIRRAATSNGARSYRCWRRLER